MSLSVLDRKAQLVCIPATVYDDFPLTIMCWYKSATVSEATRKWMFGVQDASDVGIQALIVDTDDKFKILYRNTSDPGSDVVVDSGVPIELGTWQFVLAEFTALSGASARSIYVQSATATASSSAQATAITGARYAIGGRYDPVVERVDHPNGDIAEVALWNEVLSAQNKIDLFTNKYSPDRVSTPKFYAPAQDALMRQLGSETTPIQMIADTGRMQLDFAAHTALGIDYGNGPIYSGA